MWIMFYVITLFRFPALCKHISDYGLIFFFLLPNVDRVLCNNIVLVPCFV
uniref:Uncharacterized protein n=1 Tax=Arundo donax TaxID=35708 RepID=A0A0A9FFF2_ARUDO